MLVKEQPDELIIKEEKQVHPTDPGFQCLKNKMCNYPTGLVGN